MVLICKIWDELGIKKVKFATIWLHDTVIIPTRLDKKLVLELWSPRCAQRRSIFPWGTRVRIDFAREKITLPTPQCRLIVLLQISERRLRFWVGFVCQVQKVIQHLTLKCEMLSQNNTLFLDTVQVVQEKVMFCWYWKHGQEAEKYYYLLFGTLSNSAEAKKKHFCRLFHNQGINFMGLSNTFPERALKEEIPTLFQTGRLEFCSVLFYFQNSKTI